MTSCCRLPATSQGRGMPDHPATSSAVCKAASSPPHPRHPSSTHTHWKPLQGLLGFLFCELQGPSDPRPSPHTSMSPNPEPPALSRTASLPNLGGRVGSKKAKPRRSLPHRHTFI